MRLMFSALYTWYLVKSLIAVNYFFKLCLLTMWILELICGFITRNETTETFSRKKALVNADMASLTHLTWDSRIFGQLTHFRPCRNYLIHFFRAATHNFYARFLQEIDNRLYLRSVFPYRRKQVKASSESEFGQHVALHYHLPSEKGMDGKG